MKTTKLIAAFTAVVLIATGAYSQFRPIEPIRPIQPIRIDPIRIDPIKIDPIRMDPIRTETPIQPSEPARIEEAKLRKAASDRIFEFQRVTLNQSTRVQPTSSGDYSAKAFFSVQGQSVVIECISAVQTAVAAFIQYINGIFQGDGSTANWSLDKIVEGARRDLRNHGFSDHDITLNYIDQFNDTHIVQISRQRFELMLASK